MCSNRNEGGITPSFGLVKKCVELKRCHLDISAIPSRLEVHVLIRPRPGDFEYSDAEFELMLSDCLLMKELNVDGIVVGMFQLTFLFLCYHILDF